MNRDLLGSFLTYMTNLNLNYDVRLTAAVLLKNYIADFWYNDSINALKSPEKLLTPDLKAYFMENIINVMVSVEDRMRPTIKEMIVTICQKGGGFSNAWPDLMRVKSIYLNIAFLYDSTKSTRKHFNGYL